MKSFILIVKSLFLFLITAIFLASCSQQPTAVQDSSFSSHIQSIQKTAGGECINGQMESGAYYRICMPDDWNGDLVMFAHGYVSPTEPVAIPENQLYTSDGSYIPDMIMDMGYAFATTSYRANGLVVQDGIIDLVEVWMLFKDLYPDPRHNYLVGASEGGLITTKSLEMKSCYSGGLAVCGPIGDFTKQVDYVGDFRVLFDYFFPGVLPGSPMNIPQEVMDDWETVYMPAVIQAISDYPDRTMELIRVSGAAVDPDDPETFGQTVLGVLWYNVFATNDLVERVGGNPYDNHNRTYHGSSNDAYLNKNVQRFTADAQALAELQRQFDTYGAPREPLITMHTIADPIVPFWHERMYRAKVAENGLSGLYHNYPVVRYGHCNFTKDEVLQAFAALVTQVQLKEQFGPPNPTKNRPVALRH